MRDLKWTMVTCTDCGNPIEVGGKIELPFVCARCREEADAFQASIAPASQMEQINEHSDGCEGATVEATNELIADLEDQIATYKETLAQSDRLIGDLTEQLSFEKNLTERVAEVAAGLTDKNKELTADNAELISSLDLAHTHLRRLLGLVRSVENDVHFYHRQYLRLVEVVKFYRTRKFWARLFNKGYGSGPGAADDQD